MGQGPRIPQVGEDVTDLMPGVGEDVTHLMGDEGPPAEWQGPKLARDPRAVFGEAAWDAINPVNIIKGVVGGVTREAGESMKAATEGRPLAGIAHTVAAMAPGIGPALMDFPENWRREIEAGKTSMREGRPVAGIAHTIASAIPVLGPTIADITRRAESGDIAGAAGTVGGLAIAPRLYGGAARVAGAAPQLARTIPGVSDALQRGAGWLERTAAEEVTSAMAPKGTSQKALRLGNKAAGVAPDVVQMLRDEGAPASKSGLQEQIQSKFEDAAATLDAVADARLAARPMQTGPLVAALEKQKAALTAPALEGSSAIPSLVTVPTGAGPMAGRVSFSPTEPIAVPSEVTGNPNPNFRATPPSAVTGQQGTGRASFAPTTEGAAGVRASGFGVGGRPGFSVPGSPSAPVTTRPGTGPVSFQSAEGGGGAVGETSGTPNPAFSATAPDVPGTTRLVKVGRPLGRDQPLDTIGIAVIDDAIAKLKGLGPYASYEAIRRIRAHFDAAGQIKFNPATTPDYLTATNKASAAADVGSTIREGLAQFDPETAAANGPYALWKNARQVINATMELERSQPRQGRQIAARFAASGAGASAGGLTGAVAGWLSGGTLDSILARTPTVQLKAARLMSNLAQAIRRGDVRPINSLTGQLRQLTGAPPPTPPPGLVPIAPPGTVLETPSPDWYEDFVRRNPPQP